MAQVVFVENPVGMKYVFRSWPGDVGKWLSKKTVEVQLRAVQGAPMKTGATKASIRFSLGHDLGELSSSVGVGTRQGLLVHQGTRPHLIRARNPTGHLAFFWPKVGHTVYPRQVRHPGIKANPFLTDALQKVFGHL